MNNNDQVTERRLWPHGIGAIAAALNGVIGLLELIFASAETGSAWVHVAGIPVAIGCYLYYIRGHVPARMEVVLGVVFMAIVAVGWYRTEYWLAGITILLALPFGAWIAWRHLQARYRAEINNKLQG